MKSELRASLSRIEKFSKTVTVMQGEMKLRDEALKKVPSNTHQILKDLSLKMDETVRHVNKVDEKFKNKMDIDEVERLFS